MHRLLVASLTLVLAGACGSVSPSTDAGPGEGPDGGVPGVLEVDGFESGTRLKLTWWASADGFVQPTGWHDTELDTGCFFERIYGGGVACIPDGWGVSYYSDPSCTQGMIDVWEGAGSCTTELPTYAMVWRQGACDEGGVERVFRVGTKTSPSMIYYRQFDGSCSAQGPADPNVSYYGLGEAVPFDMLVGGEIVEPSGEGRLQRGAIAGEDGSRQPGATYDSVLETNCYLSQGGTAAEARCMPNGLDGSYYTDTTCGAHIARKGVYSCESAYAVAWESDGSVCGGGTQRVYEVGAGLVPSAVYYDGGDACYETSVDPDSTYYATGAEVTDLITAERVTGDGASRLRGYYFETADGVRVRSYGIQDTARDEECNLQRTTDGAWRCVPTMAWARRLFTDAACTVALNVYEHYQGTCSTADVPETAILPDWESCPQTVSVAEVGAVVTGGPFYESWGDGTCAEVFTSPEVTWFALDTVLPADTFVELVEEISE